MDRKSQLEQNTKDTVYAKSFNRKGTEFKQKSKGRLGNFKKGQHGGRRSSRGENKLSDPAKQIGTWFRFGRRISTVDEQL